MTRLNSVRYLLDVNVLIALTDETHVHHEIVTNWFDLPQPDWGLCAFSEAGFMRLAIHPTSGMYTVEEATDILNDLSRQPGYRYWQVTESWTVLTAPFQERIYGHQQVTDAYLLGLAIQANGVLVTMDKAIRFMAGAQYAHHVLVLE